MREVLDFKVIDSFTIDEDLAKSCGWVWWDENILAISDRPLFINKDEQGRLHSETKASIAYRDGWELYHWHGVAVPKEWILDKSSITAKTALTWENLEQRRAACEILGWAKIIRELNFKTIDKDDNPQIGELIEVDLPDSGKDRFLRVECGTKREFVLSIPPANEEKGIKTALNAWNWLHFYELNRPYSVEVRT
jgi:hypothetical protein